MTDVQLYFAIGLPIIAVLTSLTVSLVQISNVRGDVESLRAEIRGVREDMREIRSDIKLLTGKVYEMMGQK